VFVGTAAVYYYMMKKSTMMMHTAASCTQVYIPYCIGDTVGSGIFAMKALCLVLSLSHLFLVINDY
jgi:hypothetical protein